VVDLEVNRHGLALFPFQGCGREDVHASKVREERPLAMAATVAASHTLRRGRETPMAGKDIGRALSSLVDAFNAHDLDAVMRHFAEDAVLEMPRGPDP
jgi:hypothetical protein